MFAMVRFEKCVTSWNSFSLAVQYKLNLVFTTIIWYINSKQTAIMNKVDKLHKNLGQCEQNMGFRRKRQMMTSSDVGRQNLNFLKKLAKLHQENLMLSQEVKMYDSFWGGHLTMAFLLYTIIIVNAIYTTGFKKIVIFVWLVFANALMWHIVLMACIFYGCHKVKSKNDRVKTSFKRLHTRALMLRTIPTGQLLKVRFQRKFTDQKLQIIFSD